MAALAGTNWSLGGVVDTLVQAAFTLYMGKHALEGLNKISVVASRGVNDALKGIGFNTTEAESYVGRVAAYTPAIISNFFKDTSGLNDLTQVDGKIPELDSEKKPVKGSDGKTKMIDGKVDVYKHSHYDLLRSGLAHSLFALIMLDVKETLWKPAHPILNSVLQYISPFRAVLGQSWVAQGIHHMVGAAKSRI